MGPSRLFHKDRSQQSLLTTHDASEKRPYHVSPRESPLHSPGLPPPTVPPYDDDDDDDLVDEDQEPRSAPYHPDDVQNYQQPGRAPQPTRSISQRSPSAINTNNPTIQLVRAQYGAASTPASAIEAEEPDRYYYERPEPAPQPQKEDRRQKRRFFGLGSSSSKEPAKPANKLGRSRSVRGKEQYPEQSIEPQKPAHHHNNHHQHHHHYHHWGGSHVSPTVDDEEEDEGGAGLNPSHSHSAVNSAAAIEKDPLRSPGFPPPISHQDYTDDKAVKLFTNQNTGSRLPLDRPGSYQSSWERTPYQIQHNPYSESSQQQTTNSYHPSPASATSASGQTFPPRSQPEGLQQHWQDQDSRPSSRQSIELPPSTTSHPYGHHARANSSQASSASHMPGSMGPPPNQPQPPSRRSSEAQQSQLSLQSREPVSYQPYTQNSVLSLNAPSQHSTQLAPGGQAYRAQPSPMQGSEQGRNTPPPSRSRDDLSNMDVAQLLGRHDELRTFCISQVLLPL